MKRQQDSQSTINSFGSDFWRQKLLDDMTKSLIFACYLVNRNIPIPLSSQKSCLKDTQVQNVPIIKNISSKVIASLEIFNYVVKFTRIFAALNVSRAQGQNFCERLLRLSSLSIIMMCPSYHLVSRYFEVS